MVFLTCLIFLAEKAIGQTLVLDTNGHKLKQFYRRLGVTTKWQNGHEIDWQTSVALSDRVVSKKTYCTRFVAAACKKLDIYTLHPQYADDRFGAGTLYDWLESGEARKSGWKIIEGTDPLDIYCKAQQYANQGYVVVTIFKDIAKPPGHSALVMPAMLTCEEIKKLGPVLIQAGGHNSDSVSLAQGFRSRIESWPNKEIFLYYN